MFDSGLRSLQLRLFQITRKWHAPQVRSIDEVIQVCEAVADHASGRLKIRQAHIGQYTDPTKVPPLPYKQHVGLLDLGDSILKNILTFAASGPRDTRLNAMLTCKQFRRGARTRVEARRDLQRESPRLAERQRAAEEQARARREAGARRAQGGQS